MSYKEKLHTIISKGQSDRLSAQHIRSGGVEGIFGPDARQLDGDIKPVIDTVIEALNKEFPSLEFRSRSSISKSEIHKNLNEVDDRLGVNLFVKTASIRPDGKVTEVKDKKGCWRVVLVGECKYQGKDVKNIKDGVRTKVMEEKGQYVMPAGNAIERVHKNIQEIKNYMIKEDHFPYVVFLQGSNFVTEPIDLEWPDGTRIHIDPSDPNLSRIDRVTASNYGMEINKNRCKNIIVDRKGTKLSLPVASIYAQSYLFSSEKMFDVLMEVALTSLEVLSEELPLDYADF